MLRDMLKKVAVYRPSKFRTTEQAIVGHQVNVTMDAMSKAGLISGLDDCCRTVVYDEADMVFSDAGIFLSYNMCRTAAEMNCRGSLLTLIKYFLYVYSSTRYVVI